MVTLLEIRERLVNVYRQYESLLVLAFKFVAVFLAFQYINGKIGYQKTLAGMMPVLILSLVSTLIPGSAVVFILAAVILAHLYALSLEAAAVGLVLFLLMFLVYFRFAPGDTILLILTPACFLLGMPYVLPIVGGLLFGPTCGATVSVGIITAYYINFVSANQNAIASTAIDSDILGRFRFVVDGALDNRAMLFMVIAAIACGAVVYVIRRLQIRYAWYIAIAAGILVQFVVLLAGDIAYQTRVSVGGIFLGLFFSALISIAVTFMVNNLDYSRIENTQFEDDDYYYFVRAVPKTSVTRRNRVVKKISSSRNDRNAYYEDEPLTYESLREEGFHDDWDEDSSYGYEEDYGGGYDYDDDGRY